MGVPDAGGILTDPEPPGASLSLWRTSSLSGIAVLVRVATGFAVAKVVALSIGPSGFALLGQVGNVAALLSTFASGGINAGVVKYLAEWRGDDVSVRRLVHTAVVLALASALIIGMTLVLLSRQFARILLHDPSFTPVFVVLGLAVLPIAVNGLLAALLNGNHQITAYVALNVAVSVLALVTTVALVVGWGVHGALHSFAAGQIVVLGITMWVAQRTGWLGRLRPRAADFDPVIAKKLGAFGLMTLTTAVTLPLAQIVIRNYLGATLSWTDAGHWQAIWQISDGYLLLITMTLGVYYLPRLSQLQEPSEIRREIARGFRIWVPLAAALALSIYLARDLLIWLLFAPEFTPMRHLFAFQLVGDVLKVASWLLAFLMVAKAMTRRFIATEVTFAVTFVLMSRWMVDAYGLVGVTYAFAINYLLYFVLLWFLLRRELSDG